MEAPRFHLTNAQAAAKAGQIAQGQQTRGPVTSIPHFVSLDFAHATQGVLYAMCGIMAFAAVVALVGLQRGRQEVAPVEDGTEPAPAGGD